MFNSYQLPTVTGCHTNLVSHGIQCINRYIFIGTYNKESQCFIKKFKSMSPTIFNVSDCQGCIRADPAMCYDLQFRVVVVPDSSQVFCKVVVRDVDQKLDIGVISETI